VLTNQILFPLLLFLAKIETKQIFVYCCFIISSNFNCSNCRLDRCTSNYSSENRQFENKSGLVAYKILNIFLECGNDGTNIKLEVDKDNITKWVCLPGPHTRPPSWTKTLLYLYFSDCPKRISLQKKYKMKTL